MEKKRAKKEFEETTASLKKARKANQAFEAVVTAREHIKTYSILALGGAKRKVEVHNIKKHVWKCWSASA